MDRAGERRAHESPFAELLHARLEAAALHDWKTTEALRAQRKRTGALLGSQQEQGVGVRASQHAFLVIGDENTIRDANLVFRKMSERLFGRVPKPGDPACDFVRDQDRARFAANLAKARTGETVDVVQSITFAGEVGDVTRWFRVVYAPAPWGATAERPTLSEILSSTLREPTSSPPVIVHIEDVTQQRLADEALERSLKRHRSLVNGALDSVSSAMFIADADEHVVWVNKQAEACFQFTRESVLGEDRCRVIQHHLAPRVADPDAFERKLREPPNDMARGSRNGFVCRIRPTESGKGRMLEYRTAPIESGLYAGGRVDQFYDITRLKETEAQLLDAKCSAERSRERTRRFLSTVSHEVRTAAAGIIGFAELLLEKDLDEESHHFAELIETNGRSLLSLLSNVLDLARIETGMSSTEDQPFSPEKCARQALDAVRSLALQKSLHLELQVTDAVPETVLGDPVRLRQVLTNLLSNAVKFTDEGRVTVRIDADGRKKEDEAEAREFDLLVSVCDTGIGIPAEEQGHLFEAFVQAGSDSDRQFSGSGLGLYIVGRLLDVMNGRIALDSAPGAGTRFHLRIPVRYPA